VLGTLAGGRIADRLGLVRTVQLGNGLLLPSLVALLSCDSKHGALPLVFLVGLVTNVPFAVLVKLGQDYLPSRPGTAAGVTLGLAVSAGGLFMPVLGLVAEQHGPRGVFAVLAVIPIIAVAVSAVLREPLSAARHGGSYGTRPRTGRPG
jgi:FSR family fosmidomycin resistance protein-like MFS transporter